MRTEARVNHSASTVLSLLPSSRPSPVRGCVAVPFMVREPHHERYCSMANSSTYPFALSLSKGSDRIATQPVKGEGGYDRASAQDKAFLSSLRGSIIAFFSLFIFIVVTAGPSFGATAKSPEEIWKKTREAFTN